jgi:hypothetical protein
MSRNTALGILAAAVLIVLAILFLMPWKDGTAEPPTTTTEPATTQPSTTQPSTTTPAQ